MTASDSSTRSSRGKGLVIVESPAKARTIGRFLGGDFTVQASIGHVRDLPSSKAPAPAEAKERLGSKVARLGVDTESDFEPIYVVPPTKKEQLSTLKRLLKGADALWLATDEDREGEAISWHLQQVLKPKVPVHRLVFHEITKDAIAAALANPREIDLDLVNAQETRRILDRLFGYEMSPFLWRRIRRGLSAGRVQSVALRLLVDREKARIAFRSATYWDLDAVFSAGATKADRFDAVLAEVGGRRIAAGRDFDPATGQPKNDKVVVLDETSATALAERLRAKPANVLDVEEKPYTQRPAPPFTTSTLQQEAGRKLRFSARRAMQVAQTLYENGVITYMRTDSTALSKEALDGARTFIRDSYGPEYLPDSPRHYKSKVKNAQEAHEAIRPAGASFQPIGAVRKAYGTEAASLYSLIWMRTVASQMRDARGRRVTVRVGVEDAVFRASGKTIDFPGFQRAYVEGSDDPDSEVRESESLLPALQTGQRIETVEVTPEGHTTQPPARYTDASLVKELDSKGIGRPSTWASIIGVLLDREYAFRKSGALVPTWTGFIVVESLREHFRDLLDYDFTARMEDDLDAVSRGEGDGKDYLRRFYKGNGKPGLRELVEEGLERADPRETCGYTLGEIDGKTIEVRVGRYGLFVTDGEANASLPENTIPDEFDAAAAHALLAEAAAGPRTLGDDPASGKAVYVKAGPYGPYVQLGDVEEGSKTKPKMVSLLKGMEAETLELETALRLLSLPRDLGVHPEDEKGEEGEHVLALTGRYGPFVKWGSESRSIPEEISVLDITLAQAVDLLKQPRRRGRSTPTALREVGAHPETGAALKLMTGRWGPYVTDGEVNASLPKAKKPEDLTVEEAVELLKLRVERIAAQGGPRRKKKAAKKKKAVKKKATTKKKASKKKATRKKATKKKATTGKAAPKKKAT